MTIIAGWASTFKETILSAWHCFCSYIPGILKYGEMYDIAGLIAPRALLIQTGKKDIAFPVSVTHHLVSQMCQEVDSFENCVIII